MVETENLLKSQQKTSTIKKELLQMTDSFKMLIDVNDEVIKINEEYFQKLWFKDIDIYICAFKYQICNWLKKVEKELKEENAQKNLRNQIHQRDHQEEIESQDHPVDWPRKGTSKEK